MKTLSPDTHPDIERMQLAIVARMPAWHKMALIAGMNAMLSGLALNSLKKRYPRAGGRELWYCLDEQRLGCIPARQLRLARETRGIIPEEDAYVLGDPVPTLIAVIAALDQLGIPYYIGGSIASGIHGTYRATADADIVADIHEDQVDALAHLLEHTFYADADMMRDAIRHRSSFNVLDPHTGFKVDVFIPQGRAFDRSQFDRRVLEQLGASGKDTAYVSSVEGTVLAKLEWYRLGGEVSDRQWNDILGILKVRATDLDQGYLRHWAAQLGLADLLQRALDDAGLVQPGD